MAESGSQLESYALPFSASDRMLRACVVALVEIASVAPCPSVIDARGKSGFMIASPGTPGIAGYRPSAPQTYHDDIAPRSSFPGRPPGVGANNVVKARWTTLSVRQGTPSQRYAKGDRKLGSFPSQACGVSWPALSSEKKPSSRRRAVAGPMAARRSPMSCGTIHVYCAELPSTNP